MYSRTRKLTQREREHKRASSKVDENTLVHRWAIGVRVSVQSVSKEVVVSSHRSSRLYPLLFHVPRRMGG